MLSISAVPGSPKVTRCTSKPAPLRISSRTPSAPASAGVTDRQRTRSRAMESASVMAPLNMRACRWASTAGEKFLNALCEPMRDRRDARTGCGHRIRPESVGSACPPQAERLDKAPDAKNESDKPDEKRQVRLAEPTRDFRKQDGKNVVGDNPPAALVTVAKPLDRCRGEGPQAD